MHESEQRGPSPRHGVVTVDLGREDIAATSHDGDHQRAPSEEHREVIVRRLLASGLSPDLLRALVPEFAPLIDGLTDV